MIPVTKPYIPNREKLLKYLDQIDASGILTNFGPLHNQLKERLEEYLGVKNLLLVSNGTLALQVAYKTLGLTGNVLTTPFSFIATASSLKWEGLEPVFGDIDPETFNLDVKTLPKEPKSMGITAIVPVHMYGNPCDIEAIQAYADRHDLKVIYDAAHAFGVKLHGQSVLKHGDASTLSFHATKLFHTGEGGAIVFKNSKDLERAERLINFGFDEEKNIIDIGINAKLSEYHAAVGLCVLDDMPKIIEKRKAVFHIYHEALHKKLQFQRWAEGSETLGAYVPVLFESEAKLLAAMKRMNDQGIYPKRYFWPSLDAIAKYKSSQNCAIVRDTASRILCLPLYYNLDNAHVQKVTEVLAKEALLTR